MSEIKILSMTTISERKDRFNLTFAKLMESIDLFDYIFINIDDNLDDTIKEEYTKYTLLNNKIRLILCPKEWRSAQKLLGPLSIFSNATILTVDDDILYEKSLFEQILKAHEEYPNCIIPLECNPVRKTETGIKYDNEIELKLNQICYGKYLSNCCLFPQNTFENTDVFNMKKCYEITNGNHDELWFWINSTLIKGVPILHLNTLFSFGYIPKIEYKEDEFQLTNINNKTEVLETYNNKISENYKEYIDNFFSHNIQIKINKDNVSPIFYLLKDIYDYYKDYNNIEFYFDKDVNISWKNAYIILVKDYDKIKII